MGFLAVQSRFGRNALEGKARVNFEYEDIQARIGA
jgi:hypothetical protein